jgi:hypothetical protein
MCNVEIMLMGLFVSPFLVFLLLSHCVEVVQKGPQPCQYYTATFPPGNNEHVLLECLGPDIPTSAIYRINPDPTQQALRVLYHLQNNTALRVSVMLYTIHYFNWNFICFTRFTNLWSRK